MLLLKLYYYTYKLRSYFEYNSFTYINILTFISFSSFIGKNFLENDERYQIIKK